VHRIIVPANFLIDVTVSSTAEAYAQFPELTIEIEFGLGTFSAKQLNTTRNTYTSMIRDVVSKC
jgi:hypothetical protein